MATEDNLKSKEQALPCMVSRVLSLIPASQPRMERGNIAIQINEVEYDRGVEEIQHNVIGRIFHHRGEVMLSTMEIRGHLELIWKTSKFMIIPIGRGYFHIFIDNMDI